MEQEQFWEKAHRVVGNIWYVGDGKPSLRPIREENSDIPVRLTSPSFTRRQCLLNEMYNMMGDLHGCHTVKFDSCNNLLSSVHTVLVNIMRSVSL